MPSKGKQLTRGQKAIREKFSQEYVLNGMNATQAYLVANKRVTKPGSAATEGWRLLKIPEVQARIRELRRLAAETMFASYEEVLLELSELAMFDPLDFFDETGQVLPMHEMPATARKMIKEMVPTEHGYGVKYQSKEGYLDKMLKHYNAYEAHQKSGADKTIKVYLMYEQDALA